MTPLEAVRLNQTIGALAPMHGVSVGTRSDRETWVPDFKPEASPVEQATALAAIVSYDDSPTAQASWENTEARSDATAKMNAATSEGKALRALVLVLIDEVNVLRKWIRDFKVEVAASTNLANLQTRIAALPNMPDRTLTQAKTAIVNTLDAGTVD